MTAQKLKTLPQNIFLKNARKFKKWYKNSKNKNIKRHKNLKIQKNCAKIQKMVRKNQKNGAKIQKIN